MDRKVYENKRNDLVAEAQNFINASNLEEYNRIEGEIKNLDTQFDEEAKAQANLNAVKNNISMPPNPINSAPLGSGVIASMGGENQVNTADIYASIEYRRAFMNSILNDAAMPQEFMNVNTTTKTTDVGKVIPTTVLEQIVEKLEASGMILQLVTRTNHKGGVAIPTSSIKPKATWVAEGETSDKQKKDVKGSITFAYHKLRCAVSVTLETEVTSLAIFEKTLIANITEAMIIAIEQAIVSGDGDRKPTGIITAEIPADRVIEIDKPTYQTIVDAEGALDIAYENNAQYCMTKKTFMQYVGMVDSNGQPIARTNIGINGKVERSLLGRTVVLCNYLETLSELTADDTVVGFIFNFKDYVLNTNYKMGLKKYEDNDTDDMVTKSVMLVDGQPVDTNSLVLIKKKKVAA
ncbi:phage major capsid protein [Paraclostridium bifermentans]|uniref:phage major capsid protein n=1 Tax=Paraclostridium bifermentans TaxID=1490 RepID=UPI001C108691|nr:phage major capsid protein [Paraclostridium bifermentans]MBU5289995.1 phage major capsid protein [Paraclostridium bifermentans]